MSSTAECGKTSGSWTTPPEKSSVSRSLHPTHRRWPSRRASAKRKSPTTNTRRCSTSNHRRGKKVRALRESTDLFLRSCPGPSGSPRSVPDGPGSRKGPGQKKKVSRSSTRITSEISPHQIKAPMLFASPAVFSGFTGFPGPVLPVRARPVATSRPPAPSAGDPAVFREENEKGRLHRSPSRHSQGSKKDAEDFPHP